MTSFTSPAAGARFECTTHRTARCRWVCSVIAFSCLLTVGGRPCDAGEPDPNDPYLRDPDSEAASEEEMKPYRQKLRHTGVSFDMVPIPGGEFMMGSPESEEGRAEDEGPQFRVKVEPFWMGKHEVTWDEYDVWRLSLDIQRRKLANRDADEVDKFADAITRATKEYQPMDFGMGHDGFPAISMTQLAAKQYCEWLSAKTGHYYRLPSEAEWEYACRAGTTTAYSFGDDPADLDDYAWYYENSNDAYQKVGQKKPNPWGLYDMHGNVAEWVLDRYDPEFYNWFAADEIAEFPICLPEGDEYPRVVRGGSWFDDPEYLRSAARMASTPDWKIQDPQLPQSKWYLTDAQWVGFRVIRPLREPSEEEIKKFVLHPDVPKGLEGRP
ncbi:MAG: formylglycine-generating enzyme family protein [Planctomycetota bacterium]|nr:MAG: formylglycine-generating enzyme family protein [Planctomycetota bacterium]REJ90590.1 MAG: formylglycine-generating enzyme family protein [Planctomycetota bacterium]REK21423.1 MAG: formylglycine-generating enzyme family protein [Planctomycetota bacterium]REK40066.1 MAG: formylglycine-generating enzyme family protein [Planctomycetota bacterium]